MDVIGDVPAVPEPPVREVLKFTPPVPWGILRAVLAPVAVLVGLFSMWGTFVFGALLVGQQPVAVWRLSWVGLVAIAVALYLACQLTASTLVEHRAKAFYQEVESRNWHGYRAHIWRTGESNVVWDCIEGYGNPDAPPNGDFSFSAWLSGKEQTKRTFIYDWRTGLGRVAYGLSVQRIVIARIHPRMVSDYYVVLYDSLGTRISVLIGEALDWWIPVAMSVDPPSLSHAVRHTNAMWRGEMYVHSKTITSLAEVVDQRDRISEGRDNLQERFVEQHALAGAALRVIRDGIRAVFETRRLEGVRSTEGKSVREMLTAKYRALTTLAGHDKHDFHLDDLPPEPKQKSVRLPKGDAEGIDSMP
jgi:hypothetical protein